MMDIISNGTARISYFKKGNGAKTLVFISNASGNASVWEGQINDARFESYSRIYIDYPGHGGSSFSTDPGKDYSIPGLAAQLLHAIETLQLREYVLVTASLGGNVAAEIAPALKECKGFFITGGSIIGGDILPQHVLLPFEHGGVLFEEKPDDASLQQYLRGLVLYGNTEVLAKLTSAYRNTDPRFRSHLAGSLAAGKWSNEVQQLADAGKPVALVYGQQEQIVSPNYMDNVPLARWRNRIHLLPDAGHLANLDQPEPFNRLLAEFISETLA